MSIYTSIIKPLLFQQDPENVHDRFVRLGRLAGSNPITRWKLALFFRYRNAKLEQTVDGIRYANPLGLAAGFDKNCELMHALPSMGFGFEEVGSITAEPYAGNPGTRLKRLPKDRSIIVYYGLKNLGATVLKARLKKQAPYHFPVGVSVAMTNQKYQNDKERLDDWTKGVRALKDVGAYLTINVSCPNVFDPVNFCDPRRLDKVLARLKNEKIRFTKPVYLKLRTEVTPKHADEILALVKQYPFVKGFIFTNLVKDRSTVRLRSAKKEYADYPGGLSGKLVQPKALALVRHVAKRTRGTYTIIGCGGIFTAEDAYAYIRAGANLVQLVTGMIYEGPGMMKQVNKGLVRLLEQDGFSTIAEAVGADWKKKK